MRLRSHDPERLALRRAARTAIVLPPLFAFCLLGFRNPQLGTFAAFGTLAMLAFADFEGPLGPRVRAYAALTVCGAILIAAGTLASQAGWFAVAGMAVVGFLVTFSSVFGGYVAAGSLAAMLSFVLAVALPAGAAELPARLLGWCLASVASVIAAVVLWPGHPRAVLRRYAAETAVRLAALVDAVGRPKPDPPTLPELRARTAEAAALLERGYAAVLYRPAGPATHDESFAYLVTELRWGQQFADDLAAEGTPMGPPRAEDQRLAGVVAEALREVAARLEHRESLDACLIGMLRRQDTPAAIASWLRRAFCLRILSYAVLSVEANAALANGETVAGSDFAVAPLAPAGSEAMRRLSTLLRCHLRIDSVWCRAAIRGGVALAVAILIAKLGRFEHGFWVVLATLSVLKSCGAGTRHTAWQALAGTVAGFGVASALLVAGGGTPESLWIALPICVFLATYTPTAMHFMVGQAMFTLLVVVLFNLIRPEGWRTGLVRLEDIVVGTITAVVVGAIFWPRGAHGQLRASFASLFETGGVYVAAAIRRFLGLGSAEEASAASADAAASGLRASDAFATFLNEPGAKRLPVSTWGELLVAGNQLRVAADAILAIARSRDPISACPQVIAHMNRAAENLEHGILRTGHSLVGPVSPSGLEEGSVPPAPDAAALLLEETRSRPELAEADLDHMLMIAWGAEWIAHLRHALHRLAKPLAQVQMVRGRPWWQ